MPRFLSKIDPDGRVLIPASMRKELGLRPGTSVVLEDKDGSVTLRIQVRREATHDRRGEAVGA